MADLDLDRLRESIHAWVCERDIPLVVEQEINLALDELVARRARDDRDDPNPDSWPPGIIGSAQQAYVIGLRDRLQRIEAAAREAVSKCNAHNQSNEFADGTGAAMDVALDALAAALTPPGPEGT